jgi:hypothetical protein
MSIEFGFTEELTNSQYAPLAALCATLPTESDARTAGRSENSDAGERVQHSTQADSDPPEHFDRAV